MMNFNRRFRVVSIALSLLIIVLLLVVFFVQNRALKRQFAEREYGRIDAHIRYSLSEIIQPLKRQLKIFQSWGNSGVFCLDDTSSLALHVQPILESMDEVHGFFFANKTGTLFSMTLQDSLWVTSLRSKNEDTLGVDLYDNRIRPWYSGALKYGVDHVFWTDPYVFFSDDTGDTSGLIDDKLGVTAAVSWHDDQQENSFVAGFDLLIGHILEKLVPSHDPVGVHVFLMNEEQQTFDLSQILQHMRGRNVNNSEGISSGDLIKDERHILRDSLLAQVVSQKKLLSDVGDVRRTIIDGTVYWFGVTNIAVGARPIHFAILLAESDFVGLVQQQRKLLIILGAIGSISLLLLFVVLRVHLLDIHLIQTMGQLNRMFSESGDLEMFLDRLVSVVTNIFRSSVCSLYFFDEESNQLILRSHVGLNDAFVGKLAIRSGKGIVGKAFREVRSIRLRSASTTKEFSFVDNFDDPQYDSFLVTPIIRGLHKIGVIVIQRETKRAFSFQELQMLETVAAQITTTLEVAGSLVSLLKPKIENPVCDDSFEEIKGRVGAPGHAFGLAHIENNEEVLRGYSQKKWATSFSMADFDSAVETTVQRLEKLQELVGDKLADGAVMIFVAHIMMLRDESYVGAMRTMISNGVNPPDSIIHVTNEWMRTFRMSSSRAIQEKADDIKDVALRLLSFLDPSIKSSNWNRSGKIVIAKELLPSDILIMSGEKVAGIVLQSGGVTSHLAILCRSLEIPLVLIDDSLNVSICNGVPLFLDAHCGAVFVNPSRELLKDYEEQESVEKKPVIAVDQVCTRDGEAVTVLANINLVADIHRCPMESVAGVGLYRSEFPFMVRNDFPDEEEQYQIYSKLVSHMDGGEFTFRTLDIGGDKSLSYYHFPKEENPFLGQRAIRFSFHEKDIFLTQLRAILRAGVDVNLKIMFPMIQSPDEIRIAKALLKECISDLAQKKIPHNPSPKIGMMVELAAAVTCVDLFCDMVDFFSIGTNDLIQYLLAVDRTNAATASLYQAAHPAVLRSIQQVAQTALANGIEVSVCGDMANDPQIIPFLLGVGITRLSVDPAYILRVQQTVIGLSMSDAQKYSQKLLAAQSVDHATSLLKN